MADWIGAQGQVKLVKKTPSLVTTPPEIPKTKTKNIFLICSLRLAESAEGLNSSLAQSPGELLSCKLFLNCKKSGSRVTYDVQHIFPGEKKFSRGGLCPPAPLLVTACFIDIIMSLSDTFFRNTESKTLCFFYVIVFYATLQPCVN